MLRWLGNSLPKNEMNHNIFRISSERRTSRDFSLSNAVPRLEVGEPMGWDEMGSKLVPFISQNGIKFRMKILQMSYTTKDPSEKQSESIVITIMTIMKLLKNSQTYSLAT